MQGGQTRQKQKNNNQRGNLIMNLILIVKHLKHGHLEKLEQ